MFNKHHTNVRKSMGLTEFDTALYALHPSSMDITSVATRWVTNLGDS